MALLVSVWILCAALVLFSRYWLVIPFRWYDIINVVAFFFGSGSVVVCLMHTYIYVCILAMQCVSVYITVYTYMFSTLYSVVYIHTCMCIHTYVHIHYTRHTQYIFLQRFTHTHTYIHTYTCAYVYNQPLHRLYHCYLG